jgi:glycosyltransferase involved in cell wall biosynthesis
MQVLALPGFKSRDDNPYNWLLYTNMQQLGVEVEEYSRSKVWKNRYDIWHLHWPELPLNGKNRLKAIVKMLELLLQISWARLQGTKIVWTAHNLAAHERLYPKLESWFWQALIQRLDGYISLSQAGLAAAQQQFPALTHLPGFVVPHGHYRGEYVDNLSAQQARTALKIPISQKVILFFGRIRAYKNVVELIRVFKQLDDPNVVLYIVGRPEFPELRAALQQESTLDDRVHLCLDFIANDQVQTYFRAADLVVLPYREILNSGSALLALSFDRPILVPLKGALGELQAQVGEPWVHTYSGEINSATIAESLHWVENTPRTTRPPLEMLDWSELAQQTLDAYQAIVGVNLGRRGGTPAVGVLPPHLPFPS